MPCLRQPIEQVDHRQRVRLTFIPSPVSRLSFCPYTHASLKAPISLPISAQWSSFVRGQPPTGLISPSRSYYALHVSYPTLLIMYFSIIGFAAFIFGRAAAEETSSSPRQASPIPLESSLVENAKIFADIVCQDAENETKNQNTKRKFKLRLLKVCCFPNLKSGQANGQCVECTPCIFPNLLLFHPTHSYRQSYPFLLHSLYSNLFFPTPLPHHTHNLQSPH